MRASDGVDVSLLFERLYAIDRALLSHIRYLSNYDSNPMDAIRSIVFEANEIFNQYLAEDEDLVSSDNGLYHYIEGFISSAASAYYRYLVDLATRTLLTMVGNAYVVHDNNVEKSLRILINQMAKSCVYVSKPSRLRIVYGMDGENFGNGAVFATLEDKENVGQLCENAFDETIDITVVRSGTSSLPAELRIVSDASTEKWRLAWPLGSGVDISYTAILPTSTENILLNADFSLLRAIESGGSSGGESDNSGGSGDIPDIGLGDIGGGPDEGESSGDEQGNDSSGESGSGGEGEGEQSSITYELIDWEANGAIEIKPGGVIKVSWSITDSDSDSGDTDSSGDGDNGEQQDTNWPEIRQSVRDRFRYNEAFFIGAYIKKDGDVSHDSDDNYLEIALVSSNDANSEDVEYVLDKKGDPIKFIVRYDDANLRSDKYSFFGCIVFTSYRIYDDYVFRIKFGPTGDGAILCKAAYFALASRLYNGGPYFIILQGDKPFIVGDTGYINVENSGSKWQRVFERLFDMTSKYGLLLPSSEVAVIED